ncbi:MAG: hypothetical protein ACREN7_06600 [Candidatus Dormibacteria bacterium]
MARDRIKTGLAVAGACAGLSVLLPPLAGALNALGSLALLAVAGYAVFRAWAWLERMVEASHRPATVRRNLDRSPAPSEPERRPTPKPDRARESGAEDPAGPPEPRMRWPGLVRAQIVRGPPPPDR